MSARMPFQFGSSGTASRPPSRAAHLQDQPQASLAKNQSQQFIADVSNPLHQKLPFDSSLSSNSHQSFKSQSQNDSQSSSTVPPVNKPLNLSSMLKSRPSSRSNGSALLQNSSRKPSEGAATRSGPGMSSFNRNPRINNSMTRNENVIAPTPRPFSRQPSPLLNASNAGISFNDGLTSNFKTPALPSLSLSTSASHVVPINHSSDSRDYCNSASNDSAHTSTTTGLDSSHDNIVDLTTLDASSLYHAATSQDLESNAGFAIGGARRVLVDSSHFDDSSHEELSPEGMQSLRTVNLKRGREEVDDDYEHDNGVEEYGGHAKRYKAQQIDNNLSYSRPRANTNAAPISRNSSAASHSRSHHSYHSHSPSPGRQYKDQQQHRPEDDIVEINGKNTGSIGALSKIFGHDMDAYVGEHMATYEEACKKWSECSMEDWVAGADEISQKFGKILDFVKEHMKTKMKLFATIENKIDAQKAVLKEREGALGKARKRLMDESGNVLGRGNGTATA